MPSTAQDLNYEQALALYADVLRDGDTDAMRHLAQNDLFFLLVSVLGRADACRPWVFDRCREVQADPDGRMDLWAREHYKSTIITFALTIQDILRDPEITTGFFSHTRPQAKAFLAQIMREFESNETMKSLFPDVLFAHPSSESPRWSLDLGIIVKRKGNPAASTVEAWGLVDGQPIGKHFSLLVYDDVVTAESVSTPEQIAKTTEAWELSLNLGADGGRRRYIGTRYHQNDTYAVMMKRGIKARIHVATDDGTPTGNPVLISREALEEKARLMGPYVFSCQMLQNPVAAGSMGFRREWMCYYTKAPARDQMNVAITVDPASKKKKGNDYTAMMVHGLGGDGNYYLLDGLRDRLNLAERTDALFRLVVKWRPQVVGYEEYGLQADIEHIRGEMDRRSYRFALLPLGGKVAKHERIHGLVPVYKAGRMWWPMRLIFTTVEGAAVDLVQQFCEDEFDMFPVATHDDMLDVQARILDPKLGVSFPKLTQDVPYRIYDGDVTQANCEYDVLRGVAAVA